MRVDQQDGFDPFDEVGVLIGLLLVLVEDVGEQRSDVGGGDSADSIPEGCDGVREVEAGVEEVGVGGMKGLEEGLLQVICFGCCVLAWRWRC